MVKPGYYVGNGSGIRQNRSHWRSGEHYEECTCPCGATFYRYLGKRSGMSIDKKRGHVQVYCESCQEKRKKDKEYGAAIASV